MNETRYGKLVLALIAVWFALALTLSALGVLKGAPDAPPIALGLMASLPILIYITWFAASAAFRSFVLGLNPRTLVYVQSWRIAGFVFLALYSVGLLPGVLALPAGWGDIAIGATAPLVAMYLTSPDKRGGFLLWQVLGVTDLVLALTSGVTARLLDPHAIAPQIMTALPMSLIPTFGVPLFFILHLICIAQVRGWRSVPAGISL